MKKNSVRILALLLAALLALSACGGKDTTTQPGGDAPAGNEPAGEPSQPVQPDNGGEAITDFVTFALQTAEMETFLILNSESQFDLNVLCNAYAPLLEVDAKAIKKTPFTAVRFTFSRSPWPRLRASRALTPTAVPTLTAIIRFCTGKARDTAFSASWLIWDTK